MNQYDPLPTEHHTFQIWQELSKDFDEYHVFARSKDMKFSHTKQGKIHLHLIPGFGKRMWVFFFLSWLLPFYISRYKPTHLLAQCPVMGGGATAFCSLIYKIPLMVELHGSQYFMPSREGLSGKIEHFLYKILSKPVFIVAKKIRSLSEDMSVNLLKIYGESLSEKIQIIPVRVDLKIFPAKQNYNINLPVKIVNVGSISNRKNQIQLVEHLKQTSIPLEITFVGQGEKEKELVSLTKELPSHIKVNMAGQVNHAQLCQILQDNDIFIHYALSEGTPRAIIEAMAVGLPVIVTSAGFMKDILQNNKNALILEEPNSKQLISYIEQLISSEYRRLEIAKAGQVIVFNTYEWDAVFTHYRQVLLSI